MFALDQSQSPSTVLVGCGISIISIHISTNVFCTFCFSHVCSLFSAILYTCLRTFLCISTFHVFLSDLNQVSTCWIVAPRNFQVSCVGYSCVLLASEAVWWLSAWTLRLTMRLGLDEPAISEQGMTSHRMWAPPRQAKLATPITVVYETDDL